MDRKANRYNRRDKKRAARRHGHRRTGDGVKLLRRLIQKRAEAAQAAEAAATAKQKPA